MSSKTTNQPGSLTFNSNYFILFFTVAMVTSLGAQCTWFCDNLSDHSMIHIHMWLHFLMM